MNTFTNLESMDRNLAASTNQSASGIASLTEQARATVEAAGLPFEVLMRAPFAAATYLKDDSILTADTSHLRIAVIGAEMQDIACKGSLYQVIPELVGIPSLQLEVDLVGPQMRFNFAKVDFTKLGLKPASRHAMSCGQWWKSLSRDRRPDVIFVFHPGMEKHHTEWLRAGELPTILRTDIPVVFFGYDLDECQRDAHILSLHGAVVEKHPVSNVDNLRLPKSGVADFGSAYFSVRGFKKNPANEVAESMFAVLNLASGVGEGFLHDRVIMRHADMGNIETVLREGVSCNVMHLISDLYLDPRKEELFIACNGTECAGHKLPAPGVAEALQKQSSDFDRALMIGEIYGLSRLALL